MNYFKQILYELRNQRLLTWISISGTALAIFLIMATFMSDRLVNVAVSPESNRHRILKGHNIDFYMGQNSGSSLGLDYNLAKRFYENLDGIERLSYVSFEYAPYSVSEPHGKVISAAGMGVDDEFWKIYDYQFISGSPFDKEEVESGKKIAVLTESTAREVFKETDVAGKTIDIDGTPYEVKGVVKDSFALLPDGTIKVFTNYSNEYSGGFGDDIFGKTNVRLLMKKGVDAEHIKQQVEKRYETLNREMEESGATFVYHLNPYTSEEMSAGVFGSNNNPNLAFKTKLRGLIYIMLLILPAINLSSMTQSRLQKRVAEIGVRRAFGAKRKGIISQILTENLILSSIGGALGLGLSLIFLAFLSGFFVAVTDSHFNSISAMNVSPVIWHVFDFSAFFIAFGVCFVLNLLSAFIPAWRASRIEPAVAIAKSR